MKAPAALFVLVLTVPTILLAGSLSEEARLADFDTMIGTYRTHYAMFAWKKEHLGLDLEDLAGRYREIVRTAGSDLDFYRAMKGFVAEWKDPHLGFQPVDDHIARLGFRVRRIEGRAIITAVDRRTLPKSIFPYDRGSELLSLDGKSVDRIVEELRGLHSAGNERSTLAQLTAMVAVRGPVLGTPVPRGNARLVIRPGGSGNPLEIQLPWVVQGRPLPGMEGYVRGNDPVTGDDETRGQRHPLADLILDEERWAGMADTVEDGAGGIHMLQQKPFGAYVSESPRGPIGYLNIPTFSPREGPEKALARYRKILEQMSFTRGLVIDLRDNGGGSVLYGFALARLFTDRPLVVPTKSLRPTREAILDYRRWAASASSGAERAALEQVVEALETAARAGRTLTDPVPLDGLAMLQPDAEVRYTRPIVVLINELCFSMAELWPALLRDNDRVTLFGATTAGAGGSIVSFGPLPSSEASFSVTVNITRREDGRPIENLGVSPDVPFEPTVEDTLRGLRDFRKAYTRVLMDLIDAQP